ncbi:HUP3, partial [Symbiodinium sp. CCMP2456]
LHYSNPRLEHVHHRVLWAHGPTSCAAAHPQLHPALPLPDYGAAPSRLSAGLEPARDKGCGAHRDARPTPCLQGCRIVWCGGSLRS